MKILNKNVSVSFRRVCHPNRWGHFVHAHILFLEDTWEQNGIFEEED